MTHYNIACNAINEISAIDALPLRWSSKGNTFSLFPSSDLEVHNGLAVSNSDIFISHTRGNTFFEIGLQTAKNVFYSRIDFVRQMKSIQMAIFNAYASKLKLKHYKHLNAWDNLTKVTIGMHDLFIVRPENGARGIGQLIFDSREITPYAVAALLKGDTSISRTSEAHQSAFLEELKERAPTAVYSSERDRSAGEGFSQLCGSPCIAQYVTNIDHEWRLITGADGLICYIIKRSRKPTGEINGIKTAIGCGNGEALKNVSYDLSAEPIPTSIITEINKMLVALKAPLQSFDLYTTVDNKWGFFETSPEFGREAVPSHIAQEEGMKFIDNVCEAHRKL